MPVVSPQPGTVRANARLNVRRGAPSRTAPWARTIEPGVRIPVLGATTGDRVAGNDRWYACPGDEYIWSGGCTGFEPSLAAPADPNTDADPDAERLSRAVLGDYVPPTFERVAGVRHAVRGTRPRGLEGMIVHFDAYRIRRSGNGPEDSDVRSIDMLKSGQQNGFHYAEISRTGRILVPENFGWQEWGYHAGRSRCPVTGRTGVSQFYVGFEMNNPGVLHPTQDEDVFCPWFNSVLDANRNVKLDARGRCTRRSASDEWYRRDEVRFGDRGNMQPHWYLPYSHAQFESLINIALFLAKSFPSSFTLDHVLGHDEVSPGRKTDPGGALANPDSLMTMAEFRDYLKTRV